jgi:hypothetical protein
MGIVPRLRSVADIGTMEYSLAPTEQGTMRACCGHMRFLQKEGALEDQRLCFNSTLLNHTPKARVLSNTIHRDCPRCLLYIDQATYARKIVQCARLVEEAKFQSISLPPNQHEDPPGATLTM